MSEVVEFQDDWRFPYESIDEAGDVQKINAAVVVVDGIDGDELAVRRPSGMEVVADIDRISGGLVMAERAQFGQFACGDVDKSKMLILFSIGISVGKEPFAVGREDGMSHGAESFGDEMGLQGEFCFVENDVIGVAAAPFRVDENLARCAAPNLMGDGAVPIDLRERALEFRTIETNGVHVGLPLRRERVAAVTEKPEKACGIAVENGVIQPDIDVVKAVGNGMDVEHLAVGDEQFGFACIKVD